MRKKKYTGKAKLRLHARRHSEQQPTGKRSNTSNLEIRLVTEASKAAAKSNERALEATSSSAAPPASALLAYGAAKAIDLGGLDRQALICISSRGVLVALSFWLES